MSLSTPCRAGKPETSSYIVRNETNGSYAIEQFLARIILGNSYGVWDKLNVAKGETVATDSSLYAAVLKYLGASNLAIQNHLDAYYGKLSITQNGSTLIPNIIWSWVGAETLAEPTDLHHWRCGGKRFFQHILAENSLYLFRKLQYWVRNPFLDEKFHGHHDL